jgi:integrase/recombinase XerC
MDQAALLPARLPTAYPSVPTAPPFDPAQLLAAFLTRRSPRTREAYDSDLRAFAAQAGVKDPVSAIRLLGSIGGPQANTLALAWRSAMLERQLSPATVNRRLSTLRSLATLLRTVGAIWWTLEVEGERAGRRRDMRGPAEQSVKTLLTAAHSQRDPWKAARDVAIVRLIYDLALRREEVVSLDLEHLDFGAQPPSVLVKAKAQATRERLSLPDPTGAALVDWLAQRGSAPGPLFLVGDRRHRRHRVAARLSGEGVRQIFTDLSARARLPRVRPHGLRHAAITTALDATSGDLRRVQRFSRHADVRTLQVYDDNRTDLGGEVAKLVAARLV